MWKTFEADRWDLELLPLAGGQHASLWRSKTVSLDPPLLYIHGFMGSATEAKLLEPWGDGRRWWALELPGHGQSSAPHDPQWYTMDAMVQSVGMALAWINQPVHLWGYSMGARVALSAALAHPTLCHTLTLLSGSPGIEDATQARARRAWEASMADRLEDEGLTEFMAFWETLPVLQGKRQIQEPWRLALHQATAQGQAAAYAHAMRQGGAGAMPQLWDKLSALELPLLLVTGELDPKFTAIASRIGTLARRASWVRVPDAGHTPHLEQPERVVGAILSWIQQQERDP